MIEAIEGTRKNKVCVCVCVREEKRGVETRLCSNEDVFGAGIAEEGGM